MLCERLGWRSVLEMRAGMSSAEWYGWVMYHQRKAQRRELEIAKAKG